MKNIYLVGMLGAIGLIVGRMAAGDPPVDWRLELFDEANAVKRDITSEEVGFLVEKEPSLKRYFEDIYLPYQTAEEKVRRMAFLRKLALAPETIKWESSPYAWGLYLPPKEEIDAILRSNDKFAQVFSEYTKRLVEFRAAKKWQEIRNDVYNRYLPEMYAIESKLPKKLALIESKVKMRIEGNGAKDRR